MGEKKEERSVLAGQWRSQMDDGTHVGVCCALHPICVIFEIENVFKTPDSTQTHTKPSAD